MLVGWQIQITKPAENDPVPATYRDGEGEATASEQGWQ